MSTWPRELAVQVRRLSWSVLTLSQGYAFGLRPCPRSRAGQRVHLDRIYRIITIYFQPINAKHLVNPVYPVWKGFLFQCVRSNSTRSGERTSASLPSIWDSDARGQAYLSCGIARPMCLLSEHPVDPVNPVQVFSLLELCDSVVNRGFIFCCSLCSSGRSSGNSSCGPVRSR